jgi:uncharacterized membrane protein
MDASLEEASMALPLPVTIHIISAFSALALGTALLSRRLKGDRLHRVAGWTWVVLMLSVAISSLWIPGFMKLSWIHLFTLLTLVSLPLGVYRARTHDVKRHRGTMIGLFTGGLVVAGLFTLVPGRILGNALLRLING